VRPVLLLWLLLLLLLLLRVTTCGSACFIRSCG
jgi:hypothetical protein